jgi:hypothetical protein
MAIHKKGEEEDISEVDSFAGQANGDQARGRMLAAGAARLEA